MAHDVGAAQSFRLLLIFSIIKCSPGYLDPVIHGETFIHTAPSNNTAPAKGGNSSLSSSFCGHTSHSGMEKLDIEFLRRSPVGLSPLPSPKKRRRRSQLFSRPKVIQTAVFADVELYRKFQSEEIDDQEIQEKIVKLILAIMSQVQVIYSAPSLEIPIELELVRVQVLRPGEDAPSHGGGDIDIYLDNFCYWQQSLNPPVYKGGHWDHAILLTGINLFKVMGAVKNHKVLGLAWVNGMCRPTFSCTLNEGATFEAAFVIAHEMAHSLGVLHDGDHNSCNRNQHLMSDKTGPGKIAWSLCSNEYLREFFEQGHGHCLEDGETTGKLLKHLPGEIFPPLEQCQLALGHHYHPYRTDSGPYNDICRQLWCASGLWATPIHPALEGSRCSKSKICINGRCRKPDSLKEDKFLLPSKPWSPENDADSVESVFNMVKSFIDMVWKMFDSR